LDDLTDFYSLVGLAWPWSDSAEWERCAIRWRIMGAATVYLLEGIRLSVGEVMRVRFRKCYGIVSLSGTGGAAVPASHERSVLLAAAIFLLGIRVRQIAENPAIPREAWRVLHEQQETWQKELDDRFAALSGLIPNPAWRNLGL
jgi:hypothetical protein